MSVVVATIRPQGGCRDQVVAALENAVTRVHAEDGGCELYALHENDDLLVMIEKWTTPETLAAHTRSAAFAQLAGRPAERKPRLRPGRPGTGAPPQRHRRARTALRL